MQFFPNCDTLRVILLLPFVTVVPGLFLSRILLPERTKFRIWLISSIALSLLTMYPASILTVVLEQFFGGTVFQNHLANSLAALLMITLFYLGLNRVFRVSSWPRVRFKSKLLALFLFGAVGLSIFFSVLNLNRANVYGDEYDISYQAYDLIDGIADGRKSYLLSFNAHPPLIMNISHYYLQIINPKGLETLSDWQYRFPEVVMGAILVVFTFILAIEYFGSKVGLISAYVLAVNNYHIWFSRNVEREIFLAVFMTAFFVILKKVYIDKERYLIFLAGLLLGGAFLVKASALILVAVIIILLILQFVRTQTVNKRLVAILLICLGVNTGVIIFNLAMYSISGYADSLFIHLLPGAKNIIVTPPVVNPLLVNPPTGLLLLVDMYSTPVLVLFVASLIFALVLNIHKVNPGLNMIILWTVCTFIFFIPFNIRAYYLYNITIPLVVLTGWFIGQFWNKKKFIALLIFVLIYSGFYSYNTNISTGYYLDESFDDAGRSGTPFILPSLYRHYSISGRSWSEDRGWDEIIAQLEARGSSFCVIFDPKLDSIALRRYFWYKDEVKKAFTGFYWPPRFPVCEDFDKREKLTVSKSLNGKIILTKEI